MSLSADYQRDWERYFDGVREQPPRDTLLRALSLAGPSQGVGRVAIDLGCGEGRDTRAILAHAQDWRVYAVDSCMGGLVRLASSLRDHESGKVRAMCVALEDVAHSAELPARADLVNASFALPFCHEEAFPALWQWIGRVLRGGGLFAGQFFGDRDSWATINPRRHLTRAALHNLLRGFEVLHLDEVEKEGSDAMGGRKHHHVFHVVARRDA